jgi:BMFP domain-containing protein YqiC
MTNQKEIKVTKADLRAAKNIHMLNFISDVVTSGEDRAVAVVIATAMQPERQRLAELEARVRELENTVAACDHALRTLKPVRQQILSTTKTTLAFDAAELMISRAMGLDCARPQPADKDEGRGK